MIFSHLYTRCRLSLVNALRWFTDRQKVEGLPDRATRADFPDSQMMEGLPDNQVADLLDIQKTEEIQGK